MTRSFRRGDWVEVRSASEILASLDGEGRLDGMPFMPEMAGYCGRRLRVRRRADKACVEGLGLRRLRGTVLLEDVRCSGSAHDGCQRNCLIFWKDAWLKSADGPAPSLVRKAALEALPTKSGERYLCQSTLLGEATSPLSKWDLTHLAADLIRGDVGPRRLVAIVTRTLVNLMRRWLGLPELGMLVGQADRPAASSLALAAGETVRVRDREAIRATLGPRGKAGGLSFEPEMGRYAGGCFEVDFPVRRIIHEETGRMVQLKDTVALKGLTCQGSCVKNCPRANTLYWREAWLERTAPAPRPRRPHARRAESPRVANKQAGAGPRRSRSSQRP